MMTQSVITRAYSIVQQVEDIMGTLRIRDERKISRAIQLVDEGPDFSLLYERLQIQGAEIPGNI